MTHIIFKYKLFFYLLKIGERRRFSDENKFAKRVYLFNKLRENFKEKNFIFLENEDSGSKHIKIHENEDKYLNELRIKYFDLLCNHNKLKIEDQVYQNIEMEMNKNLKDENQSPIVGKLLL
jgi:hypothetical protein